MTKMHLTRFSISALLATACMACGGEKIEVGTPPPPASYLICDTLPDVPDISPLTPITASNGTRVYLKAEVDARDSLIARWIVDVRGAWFSCSNQIAKVRDYYEAAE